MCIRDSIKCSLANEYRPIHLQRIMIKDDIPNINKLISNLYHIPLSDSDYIKEKIYQFSTYVEMKNLNDSLSLIHIYTKGGTLYFNQYSSKKHPEVFDISF